jgi:glucosyl-3-phosphoglycerate synthase
MADFHQEGIITTLHALHEAFDREAYLAGLESKIEEHARHQRICLLLPSLFSEIQSPEVLEPGMLQSARYLYPHFGSC